MAKEYELMQLGDFVTKAKAKTAEELWILVEKHADGYVLSPEAAGLIAKEDGVVDASLAYGAAPVIHKETATSAGAGVTITWQPAAGYKYLITNMSQSNDDAGAARAIEWGLTDGTNTVLVDRSNTAANDTSPIYPYGWSHAAVVGHQPLLITNSCYFTLSCAALANTKILDIFFYYQVV